MPESTPPPTSETPVQPPADDDQFATIEALRHLGLGPLGDRMGIELLEVGADRTVARMPVEGNTQPYGVMHGGASAVLAESIGSIAAAMHAGPDRIAMGLDLNCTHHKALRQGYVIGTATPLVRGRTVASYAIAITDEAGAPVCTARLTCLLRDR
jgi:1,4-dihydroxy-2-naphthoyl-CoA hydrolase